LEQAENVSAPRSASGRAYPKNNRREELVTIVNQVPRARPFEQRPIARAHPTAVVRLPYSEASDADQSTGITKRWIPATTSPRAGRLGARVTATASNRLQRAARWIAPIR